MTASSIRPPNGDSSGFLAFLASIAKVVSGDQSSARQRPKPVCGIAQHRVNADGRETRSTFWDAPRSGKRFLTPARGQAGTTNGVREPDGAAHVGGEAVAFEHSGNHGGAPLG